MKKVIRVCFYIQLALIAIGLIHPFNREAIIPFHIIYVLIGIVVGVIAMVAAVRMASAKIPFDRLDMGIVAFNFLIIGPLVPMAILLVAFM
jgi:hypothetical protein